ncbi:aminopeptidase N [Agromyces larvae]|uniref:Aminopeptidase N n=1 Tax=Agromyces larvae TaxID=2929802 RepID=A0ABY4C1E5_9MICO|nr:aminopeptidase N [Agromyces larvae]UOE45306.1 aminopeptidase N [Agromyces larvae]
MPAADLTRAEADARARLITGPSYEVALDLTGGGDTFGSETVVRFGAEPGASTFIESTAVEVHELVLNGRALDAAEAIDGSRIRLDDLVAENELRVVATRAYSNTGEGLHRFVDPVDGETYLYTEFAVAEANRVYAVFDQPDLKASVRFEITAPAHWTVLSNAPSPDPVAAEPVELAEPVEASPPSTSSGSPSTSSGSPSTSSGSPSTSSGNPSTSSGNPSTSSGREASATWAFEPGPVISSYIVAIVAGPYASWRDSAASVDGREVPLGLFTRRSLARYAEPEVMFELVRDGLAFYERAFGVAYPFGKYDQIFVPEYNWGAMENVGAVTFNEGYLFRSRVSDARREQRAIVVLHELSHMWFGNAVTMKWWNDLWLNESFATWASTLATSQITEFTGVWATFASDEKTHAAEQDQLPSTHPIVAEIRDLADVEVNFDAITYDKGASVLKQLVAWVGLDAFLRGVGAYLSRHGGGNATLRDLLDELERASGRELTRWSEVWLETAGVNTLRAVIETDASGTITSATIEQSAAADHPTLRPHRLAVGCYRLDGDRLVREHRVELDVDGASTPVPELVGLAAPDLLLVNDDDLTYAKVRLDARSFQTAVEHLGDLVDPVARAVVLGSAWDAVRDAELPASEFVELVLRGIGRETQSAARSLALGRLETALSRYVADDRRTQLAADAGDAIWAQAQLAEPGSDAQLQFVKAFTRLAATASHAQVLASLADGSVALDGLAVDLDLRWELLIARAALGAATEDEIAAQLADDDTAKGRQLAETARAARPDQAVKDAAWERVATDATLSNDLARAIADGWLRAEPATLLTTNVRRYFAMLQKVWAERGFTMGSLIVRRLYPAPLIDPELATLTRAWLDANPEPAPLRRYVAEHLAELERAIAARALDAASAERATATELPAVAN